MIPRYLDHSGSSLLPLILHIPVYHSIPKPRYSIPTPLSEPLGMLRMPLTPLTSHKNLISLELYHTFQELISISVLPSLISPPQCYIFALSIPTTRLNALTEPQLEYTSCPLFPPSPFIFSSSFTIFLPLSSPSLLSVPCLPYLPSPPHTMHHANRSEEPPRGGKRNWREEKR